MRTRAPPVELFMPDLIDLSQAKEDHMNQLPIDRNAQAMAALQVRSAPMRRSNLDRPILAVVPGEGRPRSAPSTAAHPAGKARLRVVPDLADEAGSLVAEYGLLVVLGATITMLATKWAAGGAIWNLFGSVLDRAKVLVGM